MRISRILVCSEIKGLFDCLQSALAHIKVPCVRVSEEEVKLETNKDDCVLLADNPLIGTVLLKQQKYAFIQGTWAGIDSILVQLSNQAFDWHQFPPVCRFAHPSFSQLIAEYVAAQVISHERGFRQLHQWQSGKIWPKDEEKVVPRCINQLTIGILGFGNMGKAVAKVFKVIIPNPIQDLNMNVLLTFRDLGQE